MKKKIKDQHVFLTKEHIGGDSFVRISRILNEFMAGFKFLRKYENIVSFFGSSRAKRGTIYYKEAVKLASLLAKRGYTIMTGGGGGIMEAANKGAVLSLGDSLGLNVNLREDQEINKYVKSSISFRYFFIRKVMFTFASEAYIFFPGGFGTLDEFFEIITLIQTKKIKKIPVILIHAHYWRPLLSWIEKVLYKRNGMIKKADLKIFKLVDTIEETLRILG